MFQDHKLREMHLRHGVAAGRRCGECVHLRRVWPERTVFKCGVFGATQSRKTDWRKGWTACGLVDR